MVAGGYLFCSSEAQIFLKKKSSLGAQIFVEKTAPPEAHILLKKCCPDLFETLLPQGPDFLLPDARLMMSMLRSLSLMQKPRVQNDPFTGPPLREGFSELFHKAHRFFQRWPP